MKTAFDELTAADVMRDDVAAIPESMSLRGAARLLADAGTYAAPVVDRQGRCVGLLSSSALLDWFADGATSDPGDAGFWSEWQMEIPGEVRVARRMAANPPTVPPETPLREVASGLLARRTTAIVVDHRHRPLGVLSSADVLAAVTADPRSRAVGRHGQAGPAEDAVRPDLAVTLSSPW